jgi:hypothetical protein
MMKTSQKQLQQLCTRGKPAPRVATQVHWQFCLLPFPDHFTCSNAAPTQQLFDSTMFTAGTWHLNCRGQKDSAQSWQHSRLKLVANGETGTIGWCSGNVLCF